MMKRIFRKHPTIAFYVLALVFVIIESVFTFCTKKPCPPFADADFDKWFQYTAAQQLIFKGNNGHTDTLIIDNNIRSLGYQASGGYYGGLHCESFAYITAGNNNARPALTIKDEHNESYSSYIIDLYNWYIVGQSLTDTGFSYIYGTYPNDNIISSYSSKLTLNTKQFNYVQSLQQDTSGIDKPVIFKLWIAKGIGIIAFEKYQSGETFVIQ